MALWLSLSILIIMNFDSFLAQISLILMKIAFIDQEKPDRLNNRPGYLQWKWWLGFFILFATSGLTVVGEAYVSLILASSTEASGLVSGVVLSIFWMKEKFFP
jgi:hypothetical protein